MTPGHDARTSAAQSVVTLTRVALAAPDLASGVTPTLEHLVGATAAVGAVYLGRDGGPLPRYGVRAASGELPPALTLPGGLPADLPLLGALEESARPLYFDSAAADLREGVGTGLASLAAAPVRVEGGPLLGAFVMYTAQPHVWDAEEAALFSMVSGTVAALAGRLAAEEQAGRAREAALRALGQMLETWDGDSLGHTDRVTALAMRLAGRLDLSPEQCRALRWGAYLHDIGKVTLLGALLPRVNPAAESDGFAQMLGGLPPAALSVITDRHERWNGGGYPAGKAGAQISLEARLFALCDAYDGLTHPRLHELPWDPEEALAELRTRAGKDFDPELVRLLIEVVGESPTGRGGQ
nr:HD domain-containing phosphohydrolase [Deinococcus aestuarii]